jgi:hypothetical protein
LPELPGRERWKRLLAQEVQGQSSQGTPRRDVALASERGSMISNTVYKKRSIIDINTVRDAGLIDKFEIKMQIHLDTETTAFMGSMDTLAALTLEEAIYVHKRLGDCIRRCKSRTLQVDSRGVKAKAANAGL